MKRTTIEFLNNINKRFYQEQYASFHETRQAPWQGWETCAQIIEDDSAIILASQSSRARFKVLDLACGNLRFERYLSARFPQATFNYYAFDSCDDLVPAWEDVYVESGCAKSNLCFQHLDIIDTLFEKETLFKKLAIPSCDCCVSFGFMHHVPSIEQRETLLTSLVDCTRQGGYIIISLWQFLENETLAAKAQATHQQALLDFADTGLDVQDLEKGDYFVGWQGQTGVYRYCHHFTKTDINHLIVSIARKAQLIARFTADGRDNNLNTYLVFKKF